MLIVIVAMKNTPSSASLPAGILASDLKYPSFNAPKTDWLDQTVGDQGQFQMYLVTGFGWCVATLEIARGRGGRADRTYATRVEDGQSVRIGQGPHVTQVVTVYVKKSRTEALKKYTDLYAKGAVEAHQIRDRISTRRAQGALRRGNLFGF